MCAPESKAVALTAPAQTSSWIRAPSSICTRTSPCCAVLSKLESGMICRPEVGVMSLQLAMDAGTFQTPPLGKPGLVAVAAQPPRESLGVEPSYSSTANEMVSGQPAGASTTLGSTGSDWSNQVPASVPATSWSIRWSGAAAGARYIFA
jgi:hypothetical protein